MGYSVLPVAIFTIFWGVVGIVCPFFAPKGPNRGIIQVVLMLTAATCWLFWLCAYMAQMNPLIGPRLDRETLTWMAHKWLNYVLYTAACQVTPQERRRTNHHTALSHLCDGKRHVVSDHFASLRSSCL